MVKVSQTNNASATASANRSGFLVSGKRGSSVAPGVGVVGATVPGVAGPVGSVGPGRGVGGLVTSP